MKTIIIAAIFLLNFNSLSAQTTDTLTKKIDQRFLGSWSGSDMGNQTKGTKIYWIQHRTADGGFMLLFTTIDKKGEVVSFSEKGKWWVENNIFHELHFSSGKTDTYTFNVLDEEHIKFKMRSTELNIDNQNYEFVDTKLVDQ